MSFAGDLAHLPIVDIVQLLHSTRKTGTLCLKSPKGESQLVFNDGYIVSANHVNNGVRIGQILLEMQSISAADLEQALEQQHQAGSSRKPLVATLIENGCLNREDAFRGLESLIEMSIVEILTWTTGSFSLDVESTVVSDEYRYFPETLKQEIILNTQSILMDALRIYDEKMRDGTLTDWAFAGSAGPVDSESGHEPSRSITADDLGLDGLDELDRKIPDVFGGLKDYDRSEIHRQKIRENAPDLSHPEQEQLFGALMTASEKQSAAPTRPAAASLAVILFSREDFTSHLVSTVCKALNLFLFTTDEQASLDLIVDQSLSKELSPLLILDAPQHAAHGLTVESLVDLIQHKLERYPQLSVLQLVAPGDQQLQAQVFRAGAGGILPRPDYREARGSFVEDTGTFLGSLHLYLHRMGLSPERLVLRHFKHCFGELDNVQGVAAVVTLLLEFTALLFQRCLTLVVAHDELIAEKSLGIRDSREAGVSPPLLFRVPLGQPSLLQKVVSGGSSFFNHCRDTVVQEHLFNQIGTPVDSRILLMPVTHLDKVIALIYADFGSQPGTHPQLDLLDMLVRHAGLVLDLSAYRKRFVKNE